VIYTFQDGEQGARHLPSFFFYTLAGWQEVYSMENFSVSFLILEAFSQEAHI